MQYLRADERVPERPFTDPQLALEDFEFMSCMVERVRQFLLRMRGFGSDWEAVPYRLNFKETGNRRHQLIVTNPCPLMKLQQFVAVGFFGQHRPDADPEFAAEVHAVDEQLIQDFPRFGGLLSYNSLELGCGDWGNLAVFKDQEGMEQWRDNPRHTEAVKRLSSKHYSSVRLHIASINGPIGSQRAELRILRSKFYHYTDPFWMASRDYEDSVLGPWVVDDEAPPYRWARGA